MDFAAWARSLGWALPDLLQTGARRKTLIDEVEARPPGDGVNLDFGPYWTLAETVVWMLTRDALRVAAIRRAVDDGMPRDSAVMEELLKLAAEAPELVSPPQVVHPNAWEELPMGGGYLAQGEIFEDLARRVRDGQVKAQGRRSGSAGDESDPIAPSRWDTLLFQSMPDGLCGAFSKRTLWVQVQFCRSEIIAWWPSRGEAAPLSPNGTFSFAEIADEVVRLNSGTTREAVLVRLDKSFEEGEFERGGKSTVLFEGPERQWWPRDRNFLRAARDMPGYERLHREAFRLPKAILRDWANRWSYKVPAGFTEGEGGPSEERPADRLVYTGGQQRATTIAAERRCREWLCGLMRAGPPTKPKAAYQRESRIGARAFNRAWGNALVDVGEKLAGPWKKPGRKS